MECFSKESIFWLFGVAVPMFMAYNGGATAATVDTLQQSGGWSETSLGFLGAMDKIGMTLSAGIWGYVLQSVSSKVLLSLGLLVNVLASAVFAMTMNSYVMYSTKLLIGMSEGLQWVWAPLWVVKWADEASLPLWINLSGCVAAGVGSGLGMLVAGFSTARGLPYAVPFQIEAAVLFLLLLLMMLTPGARLAISSAGTRDGVKQDMLQFERRLIRSLSDLPTAGLMESQDEPRPRARARTGSFLTTIRVSEDLTLCQQLGILWSNSLFCRATVAFASSNYINAGLAFIWIRLFIQLWTMEKQMSVVSFLVITGVGGAIGICLSSSIQQGNNMRRILLFLRKAMAASCLGALVTVAGLLLQLHNYTNYALATLSLTWAGMVLLCIGLGATTGLIQIVCNNSVENEKGANNFIGNSLGPLLPQMVMEFVIVFAGASEGQALVSGAVSIVGAALLVFGCVTSALARVARNTES
ncbi:unnamed protein product [Symbiodinium natans]|uniref:Major facilitator superfamily (MFS) profile domain-containing protein n=1 Tax=Symbiodinium natans TaxID=878477 RepID=A0A812NTA1_9DINO|nr:unnamed protein product [Symbiodinium natans]